MAALFPLNRCAYPLATVPSCPPHASPGQRGVCLRRMQSGQGSVEFLLAAIPVLLLGLGSIEALHWHFSRQAVSLALAQAARVAVTSHADPQRLDEAFSEALLPLYAGRDKPTARARLALRMARREEATGLPAWSLRIISPSQTSFMDFRSVNPDLPHEAGVPVIDNDYILEQHERRVLEGWPDGRGPNSGQTALEANTLVVHLTWLHEPLLPGVRRLMQQIAPTDGRYGSLAMRRAGFLPMRRELAMVMQSHPIAWRMPPHGRVVRNTHPDGQEPPYRTVADSSILGPGGAGGPYEQGPTPPGTADPASADAPATSSIGHYTEPCKGLWCLQESPLPGKPTSGHPGGVGDGSPAHGGNPWGPARNDGDYEGEAPEADHPVEGGPPDGRPDRGSSQDTEPADGDQRPGDPDAGAGDPSSDGDADPGLPDVLDDCPGCC